MIRRSRSPKANSSRKALLSAGTGLAVLALFCGGWAFATAVESPSQREAAAKPPAAKSVTAEVVKGDLGDVLSGTATIERQFREKIALDVGQSPSIVTKTPSPASATLSAGGVLLEVNGRPVIALPGAFPFYRDLTPDMTGPDVAQLQHGLTAAGLPVAVDGKFGAQTVAAVRRLYGRLGYSTPTSTSGEGAAESTSDPGRREPAGETSDEVPKTHPPRDPEVRLTMPLRELSVTAATPSTVVDVPPVGSTLTSETRVTLERGVVQALASLPAAAAVPVREGMKGTISAPGGNSHDVKVVSVAPGNAEKDAVLRLTGTTTEIPSGFSSGRIILRLDVQIVATGSLIVPTRAVVTGGTGHAHLHVKLRDGSFQSVDVDELGQLDGSSAVKPIRDADLTVGDLVRVS